MESIFTLKELYEFVMEKLNQSLTSSMKLSVLFKSIQKDFPADNYMVVIFLNYVKCLIDMQSDDINLLFKSSKLKYFKYWCFWREYVGYLISYGEKIDKVLDEGIKFINVKEFKDKQKILDFLKEVKSTKDKEKFIYIWKREWLTLDEIEDDFCKEEICNKENINNIKVQFTDLSYSPSLKRNYKAFVNTPITDDVNKYSYKDDIVSNANVIKCKIEDVTIREDSNLFKIEQNKNNLSIKTAVDNNFDRNVSNEKYFYLNNKKLMRINIIGKGGSSKVYKVFYENEFYALKIINIEMDSTLKDLLLEEIDLLKRLENVEGIIKMVDYEILPDNIFILLEYGESVLSTFIKSKRVNSYIHLNRVRYIWQEILLIVDKIHENRIIHGDLKPANFVFVKNKLRIIDFGISKTLNSNTTRLDLDMVCGTLNYCAPELFFENKKRRSSDVWSLGIILYELWYGKTPLDGYKTYLEKKDNIINISKNLKTISKIDNVIRSCLNEDCKKRPTVKELLKDSFLCDTND